MANKNHGINDLLTAKLQPHDTDIEEVVLGALLIEQSAIEKVAEILKPEVFYKEAHSEIFMTVLNLWHSMQPIDILTVTKELRSRSKLTLIGGASYITSLTSRVASSAHIEAHAKMLYSKYAQRRLIEISGRITSLAYNESVGAKEIIEEAETALNDIYSEMVGANVSGDITGTVNEIQKSFDGHHDQSLTGVDAGNDRLNAITGGLQKTDLIILAARPGKGKTARALKIAVSAHNQGKKGIFFSLEMGKKQLIQRLISEAGRFHNSFYKSKYKAGEQDLYQLTQGAGKVKLYGLDVYDTPAVNINFMRGVCKKFKKKYGVLDYIIVDYLQLMTVPDSRASKNREQEVAEISRGLKALAKNMDCPVIALAQLSRDLEKRADKRPVMADLRECLSTETSFIYQNNMFQTNEKCNMKLLSLNKDKIVNTMSTNIPKTKNIVFRLKTRTGRFIDCTANHPILTSSGYKKLKDITQEDSIAVVKDWKDDSGEYFKESRFIGWMLGNGHMKGYSIPTFVTPDPIISADFVEFVTSFFGFPPKRLKSKSETYFEWGISKHNVRTPEGNPASKWCKEKDLWGRTAKDKYIPEWFMERANTQSIVELIQGLWETDGSINISTHKNGFKKPSISFASTSVLMMQQMQFLLAKVGIIATLDDGYLSSVATTPCYKLYISTSDQQKVFKRLIPLRGKRYDKINEIVFTDRQSYGLNKLNRDTTVELEKVVYGLSKKPKHRIQTHGCRRVTVETFRKIYRDFPKELDQYKWLLSDHIFWDGVKKIEEIGEREVFDRNVPATSNFVVNGIVVHNSGAIEQDADLVLFLYRPSVYYGLSDDPDYGKGQDITVNEMNYNRLCELLIGKYRHGEAGDTIMEEFIGEFQAFKDWNETYAHKPSSYPNHPFGNIKYEEPNF